MPITALAEKTTRVLTSSVALNDAVSLIKELIDNALDARATTVIIELSANAIDVVQVKDNGTGIGVQDRQLLCKSGCTSKIRTLEDLASLGGAFLGFRGEALASACNVSGSILVTTRVDGEIVGTALKYGPGGKIVHSASASHPVGTTVRVQDFLSNIPVRRQTARKTATKTLANVRKLLLSYAFARSEIRFSLKVLKAKNDKGNWSYAPNSSKSTLAETASKIVGTEVASQLVAHRISSEDQSCQSGRDAYTLEALLIDPQSDVLKACDGEQYFSVDRRPVSADRDLPKELFKMYKKYLRKAIPPERLSNLAKPFLSLRILCPSESYDVNVEPAKDRVIFYKPWIVSELLEKMLASVYGNLDPSPECSSDSAKAASYPSESTTFDVLLARRPDLTIEPKQSSASSDRTCPPSAASELKTNAASDTGGGIVATNDTTLDEEPDILDNPWTKAKMNVRLLPRLSISSTYDNVSNDGSSQDESVPEAPSPLPPSTTPYRLPLGPGAQLLTPSFSPDTAAPYQNPGPPIQRREPRAVRNDETPPPTGSRSSALLEGWVQHEQQAVTSDLTYRQLASPEVELTHIEANQGLEASRRAGGRSTAHESPSLHLSEERSTRHRPRHPLVSPFKRPRLSQFSPSQDTENLVHSHPSNVDRLSPRLSDAPAAGNRRSDRELDDILEFERQKKVVSQQRKIALKAMRARHGAAESTSPGNISEETQPLAADAPPGRLTEASLREDFGERFNERDEDGERQREEARKKTIPNHSNLHHHHAAATVRQMRQSHHGSDNHELDSQDQAHTANRPFLDSSCIPDTDPRACLIQRHMLQQQQTLEKRGSIRSGLKVRRVKTTRLPFETIPPGDELFDLAITIQHDGNEQRQTMSNPRLELRSDTKSLQMMDEYVKRGCIDAPNWASNSEDIRRWEQELTIMIKNSYRPSVNSTAGPSTFDFSMALGKTIKAHVDEHGN